MLTNYRYTVKKNEETDGKRGAGKYPRKSEASKVETGLSQVVLIVNNWGFVRDKQNEAKVRPCELSDFQVQLKLASTAFRKPENSDSEFPFDRQAANFPYDSFCQVMRSKLTQSFVSEVRRMYEETEGKFPDEEEEPSTAARSASPPIGNSGNRVIGGRAKRGRFEYEIDDDTEGEEDDVVVQHQDEQVEASQQEASSVSLVRVKRVPIKK